LAPEWVWASPPEWVWVSAPEWVWASAPEWVWALAPEWVWASAPEWVWALAPEWVWVLAPEWVWASALDLVPVLRIPAADPGAAKLAQASAAALELEWVQVGAAVPYRHWVLQEKEHH
jgi:hypothetical protein